MYRKTPGKWIKHIDFFIFDLLMMTAAYILGCLLRYQFNVPKPLIGPFTYRGIAMLGTYFVAALFTQTYSNIMQRNKWVELSRVVTQMAAALVVLLLFFYLIKDNDFSRIICVLTTAFGIVLVWCERVLWKRILRNTMAKKNNLPQMLIIADSDDIEYCVHSVKTKQYDYFRVCGAVIYDRPARGEVIPEYTLDNGKIVEKTPVVCGREDLREYLLGDVVDEVYLKLDDPQDRKDVIEYCLELGIIVHVSISADDMKYPNASIEQLGNNAVITTSINTTAAWKLMIKRAADIAGGIIGCFIMLIMYLFIAPKIRKADPGPVFFVQERIGKNGRKFKFYKFRSMYIDAEDRKKELMDQNEMKGKIFKMKDDPRVLPGIGHKIREASIDEWPQFINVLKGDMSLVGTSPPTVEEYEEYEPHHKARLSFRPGITGLWQVSGRSAITDFEEIVRLDDQYIRTWSLKLDAVILLKTLKVVFRKEGAQ
mgnify:CR=1 FL=1